MRRTLGKRVAVPIWALVAGGLVLIGIGSAGAPKKSSTSVGGGTAATVATTEAVGQLVSTTTAAPVATTEPTTTTAAPSPAEQAASFARSFEQIRASTASTLQSSTQLQSVDRVEFDQAAGVVSVAVTTGYSTEEIIRDKAWEITTGLLAFWQDSTGKLLPSGYSPGLRLVADRFTYACPGVFMAKLADHRASRDEWQAACGR